MKRYILIVDDEMLYRELLTVCLDVYNFEVREVESGKEALNFIKTFLPDLIVSDIMMPDMDGFELCKIIKSNPKTKHIKVILFTAMLTAEYEEKAYEAGADSFLNKPFPGSELVYRINELLISR
ncbi:MAG: response regulator [Desulfobacterales bacterium]|nr:response regulator [Desulfobacterales bacterium]